MTHRVFGMFCTAVTIACLAPFNASTAQTTSRSLGPIRVTLVTGIALRKGGRVEVVRSVSHGPRNLVLVAPDATPCDLAAALSLMSALRLQYGDSPAADLRAVPTLVQPTPRFAGSPYDTWLGEQLTRLRNSALRQVDGIGIARAVQVTLPAPRGMFRSDPVERQ